MKDIVYVEWIDSAVHRGWQDEDTEYKAARCCSTGFVVAETMKDIAIAQSSSLDGESSSWGDVLVIPIGCIVNRIVISKGDI